MTNTKALRQEQYKQAIGSTNCMQCAVAYMLGVPVCDVPDFSAQTTALQAWEDFDNFITSQGFSSVILPPGFCPEADYLASGSTERGTKHIVVMNDGQLVFDPHPSNAGLSSVDCVRLLAKTSSAKELTAAVGAVSSPQLPVAKLHITETDTFPDVEVEVLNGESLQPKDSPVSVYTAPQVKGDPVYLVAAAIQDNVPYSWRVVSKSSYEAMLRLHQPCRVLYSGVPN